MRKKQDPLEEASRMTMSAAVFLASYNESIPASFPRASLVSLREFATINGRLFATPGEWSLEKHRKRFMDWLPSYQRRQST